WVHGADDQQKRAITPLMKAAECGMARITALLLQCGAKVDEQATRGAAPLHIAASRGFLAVVNVLLHAKANVDALDCHGNTALQAAGSGFASETEWGGSWPETLRALL